MPKYSVGERVLYVVQSPYLRPDGSVDFKHRRIETVIEEVIEEDPIRYGLKGIMGYKGEEQLKPMGDYHKHKEKLQI